MFVLKTSIKVYIYEVIHNPLLVICTTLVSGTWVTVEVILLLCADSRKEQLRENSLLLPLEVLWNKEEVQIFMDPVKTEGSYFSRRIYMSIN